MIECQQPQAHPSRCGCEQETSAGRNVHASESGLPYAVRAASSASHRISPAIIASDPRLMKAESSAERTLRNLGYTNNGGELWKPPIGEKPKFSTIDALRQQLADVSNERDGLRAAHDWIKCSDRLPECPHECTSDETMVSNTLWVTDSSDPGSMGMAHMRKDGSWKSYGGDYDFMVPDTITHWMPFLPRHLPRRNHEQRIQAGAGHLAPNQRDQRHKPL
ncbi:DUF551 domain-containing protein [Pseudomonas viridiflava]|nr:DUF551 domain-containing protein [Pseudomonas viridiflava]